MIVRTVLLSLALSCLSGTARSADEKFTQIDSRLAIANSEMVAEVATNWNKSASKEFTHFYVQGSWVPQVADVLRAFEHLESEAGKNEILAGGMERTDMSKSVERVGASKFQVFGFVIAGRQHLLFDAFPNDSYFDAIFGDEWLKYVISRRVFDGGFLF
jgi:hypothetical protein